MADVKLVNCTKAPLFYKDGTGAKVVLDKGTVAKLVPRRRTIGTVNGQLAAVDCKLDLVDLPPPSGTICYVVEEDVYFYISSKGSRVDVFGVGKSVKVKGEDALELVELLCDNWIRQKPYFLVASAEQPL